MRNLKNRKKIIIFISILFIITASFIGYKIFAANSINGRINIKFDMNQGDLDILCVPETTLETKICSKYNAGCISDGYAEGETITYGSLVEGNELKVGNALKCKMTNSASPYETFYYLTDLDSNPNYAVLVGEPSNLSYIYGDYNGEILYDIMSTFNTNSDWPSYHLESLDANSARNIYDINGNIAYENVVFKPPYNDRRTYVQRLFTYNELLRACISDPSKPMELDRKCNFIYGRNINYTNANQDITSFWLETVASKSNDKYSEALYLNGVGTINTSGYLNNHGIIPVIEVPKDKIDLNSSEDIKVSIKEDGGIDLNDYVPSWDNVKNNSYADFDVWQCKMNNGEYRNIGTHFSKSSYPECVDSNGNVEIKALWREYHKVYLSRCADPYNCQGSIEGLEEDKYFKMYKNEYVNLGKFTATRNNYKLWYYSIDRLGDYDDVGSYERGADDFKQFSSWEGYALNKIYDGELTLYAFWDEEIELRYHLFSEYDTYYGKHETVKIPQNIPSDKDLEYYENRGQKFLYWTITMPNETVIVRPGDTINIQDYLAYDWSISVLLQPKWDTKNTIVYNANGGANAPANGEFYISENLFVSMDKPTRTGYSFTGWAYTPDGSVALNSGITIAGEYVSSQVVDNILNLYAKWSANQYSLTVDATNGKIPPTSGWTVASGSAKATKNVTYDSIYGDLPTPTRAGYTFDGWYTSASGGIKINSSTKVSFTNSQNLYAHWTAKKYTLTFDPNGGNVTSTSKTVTHGETFGDLPEPTRAGYTFGGWYTGVGGTGTNILSASTVNITSNQTLYANWNAKSFVVTYDANGGTVSLRSNSVKYDSTYGTLPTPTFDGYEFMGWYTSKDGGEKIIDTTKVKILSDQTLYAHWNKIYNINFDANGGNGAPSAFDTTNTITIPNTIPTRDGFAFAGWQLDKNSSTVYNIGDNISISSISSEFINDSTITLYAKWSEIYTLSFDANGGSGAPTNIELKNIKGTLPSTIPEKDGYIFKGWAYENNASQEIYKSGGNYDVSKIPSNYITSTNVINLYAVWGKKYVINFDANGGTNAPSKIETLATGSLPETIPTREGYNFKGWSLTSDGEVWRSSKGYYDLSSMDTEITLYAVWQKTSSNAGDTTIKITDENIDSDISDIIIKEIFEDNNDFVNIRNKVNNRLSNKVTKLRVYDVYLVNDKGEKIQPSKSITLELSLPKDYSNNIIVYRMEDNNKLTKLDSSIEDNKIKFSTDHFSYYSIVEVDSNENINELDKPENEDGIKVPDNTGNSDNNDSNNNTNNESNEPENNSNNKKDEFENPQTGITISIITVVGLSTVALGIKYFVKKKSLFKKV